MNAKREKVVSKNAIQIGCAYKIIMDGNDAPSQLVCI